ncbi:sulfurtransferase [Paenibacillus marinisediminis]
MVNRNTFTVVMTPDELEARLKHAAEGDGSVVAADCRFWLTEPQRGREAYLEGHIPGAVYFDMNQDLSSAVKEHGGRHPLPDPARLADKLTEAGITRTSTIVAYDEQGGSGASRLWWLLQWMGHEGDVLLLDGGWAAWQAAGLPVEQGVAAAASVDGMRYEPNVQVQLVLGMDDVKARLGRSDVVIIDSRDGQRYRGEVEPMDRVAGHIPGAVNQPWQRNLDAAGAWLATDDQRERWSEVVGDAAEIIVYCGSGVTACPNIRGLWQAGYRHAKLYAGSWSDWSSYEENPVATGEE